MHSEDKQTQLEKAKAYIKARFPNVDFGKLLPINFSKHGVQTEIVSFGPKGGESKIFKTDGSRLLKSFRDIFSSSLEPRSEQIIAKDRNIIQEESQRLTDAEKQRKQAGANGAEMERERQHMQNLREQTKRTQVQIDVLQDAEGSNLESEAELHSLNQLKKKLSN